MFSRIKEAYKLYHITSIPKLLKVEFMIEFTCTYLVAYYLLSNQAQNLIRLTNGNSDSILYYITYEMYPRVIFPIIVYVAVLFFTQSHLSSFVTKNEKEIILYKMLPNSFQKFQWNLVITFVITTILLFGAATLMIILGYSRISFSTAYVYGSMLPLSAIWIYRGLKKEKTTAFSGGVGFVVFFFISFIYDYIDGASNIFTIEQVFCALCFIILCLIITIWYVKRILKLMKSRWLN
ncbi:hypothetical protein ACWG0P_06655 [Amedibacillus sp. YH-ame6]